MSMPVTAWSPLESLGVSLPTLLADWLGSDKELHTDVALAAGLAVYFLLALGVVRPKTEKSRAWLLTAFSALTCSAAFLFGWLYLAEFPELPVEDHRLILLDTNFSRFASRYFRVTLIMDILMGLLFYREHLDPLTSWFHHTAYFMLLTWAINSRVTLCFLMFLVEEIPTFLLALGSINKSLRHDMLFGSTFFALRIAYHSIHFYTVFWLWNAAKFADPTVLHVIRGNMVLTMTLHVHWFRGWVRQQLRIRRNTAAAMDKQE